MPKLTYAERTKNPKGGAINFPVACLALRLCGGVRISARTGHRRCLGVDDGRVGGKLSGLQTGSRGASAPSANLLEDRKNLSTGATSVALNGWETHSASSLGKRASEVVVMSVSLLTSVRYPTKAAEFDGRERQPTTVSSRPDERASVRAKGQVGFASADPTTSAQPVMKGQDVFAPRRRRARNDKESRWLAAAVTL